MKALKVITDEHLKVCQVGEGRKQCRYLATDVEEPKLYCLKVNKHTREIVDEEANSFTARMGNGRTKEFIDKIDMPMGDNCAGFGIEPQMFYA